MSRADPVPTGHKRCSRCRRIKALGEFHRSKHNRSGDGYRSACKKCRWKLPQEIPDQSRETMEAASDTDLRPRQPPPESGPGITYPMPEPVPEPVPASSPAMPRYLRDALADDSPESFRRRYMRDEMTPDERVEETRIQRIYPRAGKPNQIPGDY